MPRLPDYTPQKSTRSAGTRRLPKVGGGEQQARALAGASEAVGSLSDVLREREERGARIRNQKILADARLEWTERLQRMRQEAPPGAPKFTDNVLAEFDKYKDQTLERAQQDAPNTQATTELDADLQALRSQFGQRAIAIQAELSASHHVQTVNDTINNNANAVRADPTLLDDTLEQHEALIDSLDRMIPADEQANLREGARERVTLAAAQATLESIETTPEADAFLADLTETDFWQSKLSERAYSVTLSKAQSLRDELDRKMESEYLQDFEEWERQSRAGIVTDEYTVDDARTMLTDPEQREEVVRRIEYARNIGEQAQAVRLATPAEIAEQRAEIRAAVQSGDTERFDENVERMKYFEAAVEQRNKELEADAAGYVLQHSERVRQLHAAATDSEAPADAGAMDEYAAAMEAEQRRLRGSEARPQLLTGQQVDTIAARLDDVGRSPTAADDAWAMLASESGRWGDYWPDVARQLREAEVISGPQAVAANLTGATDQSAGRALVRAAFLGQKELKTRLEERGEDLSAVDEDVNDSLAELRATLPADVLGAPAAWRDHTQAVKTLGMYLADREGVTVAEGVEMAADRVVNDRYHFAGSYRIPRTESAGPIIDGARHVRDNIAERDFVIPPSLAGLDEEQAMAAVADAIAGNGFWITNGDESGLQLVYGNGAAVERIDASGNAVPFELSWGELRAATPAPTRDDSGDFDPLGGTP